MSAVDLAALAIGPVSADLVGKLRAAEISKNLMMIEVLRRSLAPGDPAHSGLERAIGRLERLHRKSPDLMRSVVGLPHLGAWVYRSLATADSFAAAAAAGERRIDAAYLTGLVDRAHRSGDSDDLALAISHEHPVLRLTLGTTDPNLDLYGPRAEAPSAEEAAVWRARLTGAWRLIVTHDIVLAEAMAAGLRTLVPLREGRGERPRSATSGRAFGAVAMSLPPDDASCADTLIHEFRHLLLGAVLDHFPLVRHEAGELGYAPWREDPRPPSGLLFGAHAYVGLLAYWRRLRGRRAALEIDRWLEPTAQVIETLDESDALTRQGRLLVAPMRRALAHWRAEGRDTPSDRQAEDAAADHRLRWRLRHLSVDAAALDALTDAWAQGRSPQAVPAQPASAPVHQVPPSVRSHLLERDGIVPESTPDSAVKAILAGDYEVAATHYKARIAAQHDRDVWAGLALCRGRTVPLGALATRPELVAALHGRLQADGHGPVDPDLLGAWLDGSCAG